MTAQSAARGRESVHARGTSLLVSGTARAILAIMLPAVAADSLLAGPQHWGFGFPYLAVVEEVGGQQRLAVYEPPLRAKDCVWPTRWLNASSDMTDVQAGGIAIGNFWPSSPGCEYLAAVRENTGSLYVDIYAAPEHFSTGAWSKQSTSSAITVTGSFLAATTGDLLDLGHDQLLITINVSGTITVVILDPPTEVAGTDWTNSAQFTLPGSGTDFRGIACGDFWAEDHDRIALATEQSSATQLSFYGYDSGTASLIVTDAAGDLPLLRTNGLTAADYEKDGFDVLTLIHADGDFELRAAPARAGDVYNEGSQYNGRALSGQWLPGNGGSSSRVVMTGSFDSSPNGRLAFAAGRIFGYITDGLGDQHAISTESDAQVAFVHRSPRKDERLPYGWPAYGETVSFEVNVNNNGDTAIPAGQVRLKAWVNRSNRNPDTHPDTCAAPDVDLLINEQIPAYDPNSPVYVQRTLTTAWPYSLVAAGAGATWQRLNVYDVGMRYIVVTLEYSGDTNTRNNRYEIPMSGLTFHPIFREWSNLGDRGPTVVGDPSSQEYCRRKLADAITCMWERSATSDGSDVLHACYLDSYEVGWPDDQPDPSAAWAVVQAKYEGWREQDIWAGRWGNWERLDWIDGDAELHETGHLFHPIGDLYQYWAWPARTGLAHMADGGPVQINAEVWCADSYGSGHTKISWPACDLMKRSLAGARNHDFQQWWKIKPDQTYVRVLDRDGLPVAGAEVSLWAYEQTAPAITATTGADGRADVSAYWGTASETDAFGLKHYNNNPESDSMAEIITIRIGTSYQDCGILGTDDSAPHSRHTSFGHSLTDTSGWTYDFHTNYSPSAPTPEFDLEIGVQGRLVQIGITGESGATYRLYRRWEPAYIRTLIGEYTATGEQFSVTQDMAQPDGRQGDRSRAIYEVTQVIGTIESLPRTVSVTAVADARGISVAGDGRLLVTANAGMANPWVVLFNETTPYREYMYHYRYGHVGARVVESKATPGTYFATLVSSDTEPDYRFDIAIPPDVRNEIGSFQGSDSSSSEPYWIEVDASTAARINAGDQVSASSTGQVIDVQGTTIYTDVDIFDGSPGDRYFSALRLAGRPGSDAAKRELQDPRGLDTIMVGGQEYIVIADTGNGRIVVWDANTRYVTHWQSSDPDARPAAIAAHPSLAGAFFALDRRAAGDSQLHLFQLVGSTLQESSGYPVEVPVGDLADVNEMGLAAAVEQPSGSVVLAMTDAASGRVLEMTQAGTDWQVQSFYDRAAGTFVGSVSLSRPSDVVFATGPEGRTLYAVDGTNRVVRLAEAVPPDLYAWSVISGPVSDDSNAFNHIGTDGSALYAGFTDGSFWRYTFTAGLPTLGRWQRLADPPRTMNGESFGDLGYQTGYFYAAAAADGGGRTLVRYDIANDSWDVWQQGGMDLTISNLTNAAIMDPSLPGVGYGVWHAGERWVQFNWDQQTADNAWISTYYDLSSEGCADPHWVSRNEDPATDGQGTYYATHNDWQAGLTSGDVVYRWSGLAKNTVVHRLVDKPWQAGMGQSLEFVPGTLTPSGHDELWLIRGTDAGEAPNEGWGDPTSDWARLDLNAPTAGWTTGSLPGTVGNTGELVRIGRALFARGVDSSWYVMPLASQIAADFDGDEDVDADDTAIFEFCASGPGVGYDPDQLPSGCDLLPNANERIAADFDKDGDVDQADFSTFQRCYSGEGVPADPSCAN